MKISKYVKTGLLTTAIAGPIAVGARSCAKFLDLETQVVEKSEDLRMEAKEIKKRLQHEQYNCNAIRSEYEDDYENCVAQLTESEQKLQDQLDLEIKHLVEPLYCSPDISSIIGKYTVLVTRSFPNLLAFAEEMYMARQMKENYCNITTENGTI